MRYALIHAVALTLVLVGCSTPSRQDAGQGSGIDTRPGEARQAPDTDAIERAAQEWDYSHAALHWLRMQDRPGGRWALLRLENLSGLPLFIQRFPDSSVICSLEERSESSWECVDVQSCKVDLPSNPVPPGSGMDFAVLVGRKVDETPGRTRLMLKVNHRPDVALSFSVRSCPLRSLR